MSRPSLILFALLSLAAATPRAVAQQGAFWSNTFLSAAGGAGSYANDAYGAFQQFGPRAQVAAGKWLFHDMGARLSFAWDQACGGAGEASHYLHVDAAFLYSPLRSLDRHNHATPWGLSLYAGMGAWQRLKGERQPADVEFVGVLGVVGEYALNDFLQLNLDIGTHVLPAGFDFNEGPSAMPYAMLGLAYEVRNNPYRVPRLGESRRSAEDWYAGVAAGGGAWVATQDGMTLFPEASVGIVVGKRLSTVWETRARIVGDYCFIDEPFFRASATAQLMRNVLPSAHAVDGPDWSLSPYLGAGLINDISIEEADKFLFCAEIGLNLRRRLDGKNHVYLDLGGMVVPPRVSQLGAQVKTTLTVGWVYDLGRTTLR